MCAITLGMAEISLVDITMPINQHFAKDDKLGMFPFGNLTYCPIFRPRVNVDFLFPKGTVLGPGSKYQMLACSALAQVLLA